MQNQSHTSLPAVVAATDFDWYSSFTRPNAISRQVEVNFWRPGQQGFSALPVGAPLFFRLKQPRYAIAGFGFYSETVQLPIRLTWDLFQQQNGCHSFGRLKEKIAHYRTKNGTGDSAELPLVSILLRDAVFLPPGFWMPWDEIDEWSKNIVAFKKYNLLSGPGIRLAGLIELIEAVRPPDLADRFEIPVLDERRRMESEILVREGQGTFRARLFQNYGQCAVTGEHSLPVLDAAHITPYLGPESNHPQNGLLLRSDVHRLFDAGYVTVTPDYRFLVSKRLQDEFANGKTYYGMQGTSLLLPTDELHRPSIQALDWHSSTIFKG